MILSCDHDESKAHPLTGSSQTFLQEGFGSDHEKCFITVVDSTCAAMLVLLSNTSQPWICSLCRYERDHKAMGSKENPDCTNCGMSIHKFVRYYVVC